MATYLYYGTIGKGLFEAVPQGVVPAIGIVIVVGMHALNALACFSVAYSLLNPTKWGHILVFAYDGFIFLIFLMLLLSPLFAPTAPQFAPTFLLFNFVVLFISGATVLLVTLNSQGNPSGGKGGEEKGAG